MTKNDSPDILAPNVEAGWRDDFIVELRLQGVSGQAIADALVEVESHCSESGQSAIDAFGPAAGYATALELPDESRWTGPQLTRTWVQLLLVVGGVTLTLWGILNFFLAQDQRAEITVGWLVSVGATLVLMVLVFVLGEQLIRFLFAHPVLSAVGWGAAIAAVVAVSLPFEDIHLGSVSAIVPIIVGVAALMAWIVITLVLRRRGATLDDPLVAPLI